jgi:hypothetical protein
MIHTESNYIYIPNYHWRSGRDFNDDNPYVINHQEDPKKKKWKIMNLQKLETSRKKFIESLLVDSPGFKDYINFLIPLVKPIVIAQEDNEEEREKKKKLAKKELQDRNVNENIQEPQSKKEAKKGQKKKAPQVKKIDKIREENRARLAGGKELKMQEKLSKILKQKEKEKV